MDASRRKNNWYVIVAILVLLGVYVGSYFVLGEYEDGFLEVACERNFSSEALMYVFSPIGLIEAKLRGGDVLLTQTSGVGDCIHIKPEWPFDE